MGWLDKLLGRDKKKADDMSESSMRSEGMGQEQGGGMSAPTPTSPDPPAQEGQEPPSTP